uniref:Uncharacterized protein n=1 Tax=Periophthalmus magnuspinnatus TaxID=409849 RepID=A0A3B3ZU93_9GOBI
MISGCCEHVSVHCLLFSVQWLLQNEFCELVSVALRLHVQIEVVIVGDGIGAERVCAHVGVERVLYRETRTRDTGWVVIDIHHFYFDTEKLHLLTDLFTVYFLLYNKRAILQVYLQIRGPGKFSNVQSQILCNIPNHGAWLLLLRHGVVQLRRSSIDDGEQQH